MKDLIFFRDVTQQPYNLSTLMDGSGLMETPEFLPLTSPQEKLSGPGKILAGITKIVYVKPMGILL